MTGGSYRDTYNANVVVIAIVSTVEGASNAKAIAATPGIHAIFVDAMNLESSSGYPQGSPDYNKLADFVRLSALASKRHLCTADRSNDAEHSHLREHFAVVTTQARPFV